PSRRRGAALPGTLAIRNRQPAGRGGERDAGGPYPRRAGAPDSIGPDSLYPAGAPATRPPASAAAALCARCPLGTWHDSGDIRRARALVARDALSHPAGGHPDRAPGSASRGWTL